jgi:formylglycine-generating enzyme required for sulfatase activity
LSSLLSPLCLPAATAAATTTAAEAPWPETLANPKPAGDDLILPMPCGGAMVFRTVEVPAAAPLDDYRITLGGTDEAAAWAENKHTDHLAGSFASGRAARSYFIGKYEVSDAQFQALSGTCPTPSPRLRLPKVNVSWFEAVAFADAYNIWLRKNAVARLPKEEQEPGFVRLPTEAEWEFAARGGTKVTPAGFEDRIPPCPDGLARCVWFQGSQSANGKLQLTGLLQANPLGLHDMLGNADEMVWEPFRLNRVTRPHGQAGGFVVRGGNIFTSEADVRTSYRQEQPYYDAQGARRGPTTGFRLALVAPVVTSPGRLAAIRKAWTGLGTSGDGAGGAGPALSDPVDELGALAKATDDDALRRRLQTVQTAVKGNIAARDEQRDRAARVLLRLGAFLGRKLVDDARSVDQLAALVDARTKAAPAGDARAQEYKRQLDAERVVLAGNLKYYGDTVLRAAEDYSADILTGQNGVLAVELRNSDLSSLVVMSEIFLRHTGAYRTGRRVELAAWLDDLKKGP